MLDYQEYIIDEDEYQGDGNGYHHNGYNQLDGDYALFYKVANGFTHKVKREDREDFLHDLIVAMARVKASYTSKGKELTTGGLVRVAQYELADYWRKWFYQKNGIECHRCGEAQKQKCREQDLFGNCPRAIKLERLDRIVEDGNGGETALHELIADDNAIDLVTMLDARFTLKGYPTKLVKLAYKRYAGYQLDANEQSYFRRHQKKLQKALF